MGLEELEDSSEFQQKPGPKPKELKTSFAFSQFESKIELARLFDIIDRIYQLLIHQWEDSADL